MTLRIPSVVLCLAATLLFALSLPGVADARGGGRGGGGSYSRSSPARTGGFSTEVPSQLPQETRSQERREQRQDRRGERGDDWRDRVDDDHWDGYYPYGGTDDYYEQQGYLASLPCNGAEVSINGSTYYHCGDTWYILGYSGDDVVYIETAAP